MAMHSMEEIREKMQKNNWTEKGIRKNGLNEK
jgi:hypothetical protein